MLAARTLVAARSPGQQRTALLAAIGASYGLGFAVGPVAGGALSARGGLAAPAWAAAAASVAVAALAVMGLPGGENEWLEFLSVCLHIRTVVVTETDHS